MKRSSIVCLAMSVACLFTATTFAADDQKAPPPNAAAIPALVKQLGGDNFAQREQAQKALEATPVSQLGQLRLLAERESDPETKARLQTIIDSVEEVAALSPPPISVDLDQATVPGVAFALSNATGISITAAGGTFPPMTFTLKAKDQPFWEVMKSLQGQHPIWLTLAPADLRQRKVDRLFIQNGIAVILDDLTRAPKGLSVPVTAMIDPRIKVLSLQPVTVDDIRDNEGHIFSQPAAKPENIDAAMVRRRQQLELAGSTPAKYVQSANITFAGPDKPGTSVTIRGKVRFLVQISEKVTEIADVNKALNADISIGDSKLTLRSIGRNAAGGAPAGAAGAPVVAGGAIVIEGGGGAGGGLIIAGGGGGGIVINGGAVRIGGIVPAAGAGADAGPRAAVVLEIVPNDSQIKAPTPPNVEITATGINMKGAIGGTAGTRTIIDNEGASGGMTIGTSATTPETTRILITDAKGKTVANYTIPRGLPVTSVHGIPGTYEEPLKMTISAPTKTREVSIPFEFKDVPIQK